MKFSRRCQHLAIGLAALSASVSITHVNAMEPSHLEHAHGAGTIMFEAMWMRMNMEGLRAGTSDVSNTDAMDFNGKYKHSMIPTEMTMDMFMLMPMYNFTKEASVMLMVNYLSNNMGMLGFDPDPTDADNATCDSDMKTSGLGDTQVSFGYKFLDDLMAASLELNIPTGSTSEKVTMKMNMGTMCHDHEMYAPYGMQLGSGTYDITPGLTYLGAYYSLRYGAQVSYKYRPGENDNGYTLGNEAKAKIWVRKPFSFATLSATVDVKRWGSVKGSNPDLKSMLASTANTPNAKFYNGGTDLFLKFSPALYPENYGGWLSELTLGASVPVAMMALGLDVVIPVYQDFNGIQMKRSTSYTLKATAMF